jgi:hypothetical protein
MACKYTVACIRRRSSAADRVDEIFGNLAEMYSAGGTNHAIVATSEELNLDE